MAYENATNNVKKSQEVCKICGNTGISLIKTNNVIDFTECSCGITSDVITSLLSDLKETQGIQENFTKLVNKLMLSHQELNAKKSKIMVSILLKYNNLSYANAEKPQKEAEEVKNKTKNTIVTIELTDNNCRCKKSAVTYRVFKIIENDVKKSYKIDICRCNCEHVKQNGFVPEIASYQEFLRNEWTSFEISEQEYSCLTSESKIEIVNNFSNNLFRQWDTNAKLSKIRNVNKIQLISKVQSFFAMSLDKINDLEKACAVRTMLQSKISELEPEEKIDEPIASDSNVIPFASKTVKLFEGKKYDCPLVWFLTKHPVFPLISDENKAKTRIKQLKIEDGYITEKKVLNTFGEYGNKDNKFDMTSLVVSEAEERFLDYILHMWYVKTEFRIPIFETTFNDIHKTITGKTNISKKDLDRYREYLVRLSSIEILNYKKNEYFGIISSTILDHYNDKGKEIIRINIDNMIYCSIESKQYSATYLKILKEFSPYSYKILRFLLSNNTTKMMDMSLNKWKTILGISNDIEEKGYVRRFQESVKQLKAYGIVESFEIYKSQNTGEKIIKLSVVGKIDQVLLDTVKKQEEINPKNTLLPLAESKTRKK